MKWITRHRPKIDRIACPWLIRRFIDRDAEIIYVPDGEVITQAEVLGATPFDVPGVEFTHYGDHCTFDYFLKKYKLEDPALKVLAPIVRGADTDQHHLAEQAAGLWAISAGLAHNVADDYELLERGMMIYDALYSWAKYHRQEKHVQNPTEQSLNTFFTKVLKNRTRTGRRMPTWAKRLKEMLQNPVDDRLSLNDLAKSLDMNPGYLSREFSKYFDDLSFLDYVRKLRMEKAIELLQDPAYSIAEISRLAGFSDPVYFARIFKKTTGKTASSYRKMLQKSKASPKG